jgi:hydrogenase nickel incorporation protein HypA/HybF
MHEISICQSLVSVVLDELTQRALGPGRLQRVRVVAGQLHQLVPDALTFAYELLTRETPAAGSQLDLRVSPLVAHCASCGWNGAIEPPVFLCEACGGGVEITGGDELFVEELEISDS